MEENEWMDEQTSVQQVFTAKQKPHTEQINR